MESNEEYLLRVLHRTNSGLQDSLIPAHGAKLTKLVGRFEQAESITQEVETLMYVQGFGKCALAMKWLLERMKDPSQDFAPEQFESDILLLNEKLFEAFLNQPFDMPDFGRPDESDTTRRPVQNIQVSADEFFGSAAEKSFGTDESSVGITAEIYRSAVDDQPITSSHAVDAFESALIASSPDASQSEGTPSLADVMDTQLYEAMQRLAQSAIEFRDKLSNERPISAAVIRVSVRNNVEAAQLANNVLVADFYLAVLKFIAYADEQGKIKSDTFAEAMGDIGDRVLNALQLPSGGVTVLKSVTSFINDPKGVLKK
ncbi:MAG: hypothetical protein HYV29_09370 [Ignavibacteriales bacterium]|nr:hypothetical protein [Ignavibacteriales bacterium]